LARKLARMETQALFAELLPRLEQVELAGTGRGRAQHLRQRPQAAAHPVRLSEAVTA